MKNPFSFFDKIFCINLAERADRWSECQINFQKYEIEKFERIEGIKVIADLPPKKKGQIGCALSFTLCIDKICSENLKNALILEDDFEFIKDKNKLYADLNSYLSDLPENWDCLYLGGTIGDFYGFEPIQKYSSNLFKLNCSHTTHAIAFSNQGAHKMKKFFSSEKDWRVNLINSYEAIDVFLAKDYQKNTNSFITNELICLQRISKSNIENEVYDYTAWMKTNFEHFKNKLLNE